MIARSFNLTTLALLGALAVVLAVTESRAEALVTHYYSPAVSAKINEGIRTEGPHGEKIAAPGPLELGPLSMIVDSGHLWTVEGGDRIDEFDAATGAFLAQLATSPVGVFFGVSNQGRAGVAVGHATGQSAIYVGETTNQGPAVAVYAESGTLEATWTGAGTPAGFFSREGMGVAVDDSTSPLDERKGDVYVSSSKQGAVPGAVDVFRPEADGKEHYVGQITGPSPGEPFQFIDAVGVNDVNGDVVVIADKALDIFEPAALGEYVLVHRVSGPPGALFSEPFNLAVDGATGDIYIDEFGSAEGSLVDQFSSTGAYLGRIAGADTPHGSISDVYAVAVDPESHNVYVGDVGVRAMDVFGPDIVFPDVSTEPPTNTAPFNATLNGTVNPQNAGPATCRFEWGTGRSFGSSAECEPSEVANGAAPVPVHADLSGLQSDTTYFYRLEATNANGINPGTALQDQEFTTPGPGIREASVTNLASTSATLQASIDPHGAPASYYFQYGPAPGYGSYVPGPPGEAIGSGEGALDVPAHHIQGLQPGSVYHYRVVVISESTPGEFSTFYGPDQTFTTQTAAVTELPDDRQWEMVSPPDKQGARIYPIWETGVLQAAAGGSAISYLADLPSELQPQGFTNEVQMLSTRGPGGWTTQDIALPHSSATGKSVGQGEEYKRFSADLSLAVVQPYGNFDAQLSAEASEPTAMLHTLGTACAPGSCYRPLVTSKPGFANVPPGTVFGEETEGRCEKLRCGPNFIDATSDLRHVVFGSVALDSSAGDSPYEWSGGQVRPLGVSPDGLPTTNLTLGNLGEFRGAISNDGERVVLSSQGNGQIFLRDVSLQKTVQLNVAEPECVAKNRCRSDGGSFQLANAEGTKVVFTDSRRLTKYSGEAGQDLYQCEMVQVGGELQCKLADLAHEALGRVLGASEDGSYLYFVAESSLASGAPAGEPNLYVRQDGVTKFVAALSRGDGTDWGEGIGIPVRVSSDGKWLEFMSQRSLTGYDNRDAVSGKPDAEVYLYSAGSDRLVCASCDPTGARPTGAEYSKLEPDGGGLTGGPRGLWSPHGWVAATVPGWLRYDLGDFANQPRYLSNSGRLFFNSGDALVPQDVNGTQDVYEYEPPGVGDCRSASSTFSEKSGGCVALISAGTSAEESAFLEASEDGGDVFFLTYSKLAPQDYDASLDVYDAHTCTSSAPCFPAAVPQPPACTTAEACRAAPTPQPALFGAPSSATFSGAGNITPPPGGSVTAKSQTRSQKLAGALKACRKRAKRKKRAVCEKHVRALYGPASHRKAAAHGKGNR
jgi:hypothetical protein